jgi:NADH dehydrogenase
VVTLTRDPKREHPLRKRVKAYPLNFSDPAELEKTLRGVHTLVNTYWVRFNYPGSSFAQAVENSRTLIAAAERAGVKRIVHISVSNPLPVIARSTPSGAKAADEANSNIKSDKQIATDVIQPVKRGAGSYNLPYYRGKAEVEEIVKASKMTWAILQPTLIFGQEEVLAHNIAWMLRHFPAFAIAGDGKYRVQPIFVEDLAKMAAEAAATTRNEVLPAGGPEAYRFNEFVHFIKELVGSRAIILHLPPWLTLLAAKMIGALLRDISLTREELRGLMEERLHVGEPALGTTRFSDWARENRAELGKTYRNELQRHHGR